MSLIYSYQRRSLNCFLISPEEPLNIKQADQKVEIPLIFPFLLVHILTLFVPIEPHIFMLLSMKTALLLLSHFHLHPPKKPSQLSCLQPQPSFIFSITLFINKPASLLAQNLFLTTLPAFSFIFTVQFYIWPPAVIIHI